jgi:DNA-binding NarL/FixJ family response regulator
MARIRVLIADDQTLVAQSLKVVLETQSEDLEVVGTAHDGREAVEMARELRPDVVLMDVRMPVLDGVEATRLLRRISEDIRIIMLSTFDDDEYVQDAMRLGAAGYLLKDIQPDELMSAIVAVHKGNFLVSENIVGRIVGLREDMSIGEDSLHESIPWYEELTGTEREVLHFLRKGYSNKEISECMNLAVQTVKNRVSAIYDKAQVHDREAVRKLVGRHHV